MTAVLDAATSSTPDRPTAKTGAAPRSWIRERGMGATVLVSAISAAFGVTLVSATGFIGTFLAADPFIGQSGVLAVITAILSVLLLGVAMYVGGIVTANTFSTIVAGRARRIALMRLIGASARSQRQEVARQGLIVGVIGAVVGLVVATGLVFAAMPLLDSLVDADVGYGVLRFDLLLPPAAVALTTWAAAWAGSRRVLTVTPLEALGSSVERSQGDIARRAGRRVSAFILGGIGVVLLVLGLLAGLVTPLGVVVSFLGGLASFTAITLAAPAIMPPILRMTGRLFGSSATARLATENATRYPERSSRMAIGVVIGVALVTMFAVAAESVKMIATVSAGGVIDPDFAGLMDSFSAVMMALVGVSAVIAAVGLVNLLTIGIVQRTRELGLLRALGLTAGQLRRMVLLETAHITITALAFGLVLGITYGWIAAQSVLGSVRIPPQWASPTFVWPAVPLVPTIAVVVATVVLSLVATVVPTRLATRVTAVEALAE